MQRRIVGQLALPMGGHAQLQQVEFGHNGPLLSVVSGLHGDEYNGLVVSVRLARFLGEVEARRTPYQLTGRVRLLPAVNTLGLLAGDRNWPFDHSDLNRLFPGYRAGEATQRLANLIYEAVRPSHMCIDIHSGGAVAEWPQVRLFSESLPLRQTSVALGLPLVWVRDGAQTSDLEVASISQGTLSLTLQQNGVDSLVLAGGQVQQMDMDLCEQMTTALVRLTLQLGILRGPAPTAPPPVFLVRNLYTNFATRAGLWLPFVKLGQKVYHEQPLGEIVDAITGEVLENCLASVGGLVMSLCSKPLVNSGSLICRIAVI